MQYLSRRYGVYRLGNGQYLLSTMTAGIRQYKTSNRERGIWSFLAIKMACCRFRPLLLVVAVFFASQGYLVLTFLSALLLAYSLIQFRREQKPKRLL